jgi:hypothetical protein
MRMVDKTKLAVDRVQWRVSVSVAMASRESVSSREPL